MEKNLISKSVNLLYTGFLLMPLLLENTQARIGYFWHITDLHLDTIYSTQGDVLRSCWRIDRQSSSSGRTPGRFGDYLCDSPWSLIESAARAMKSRQGDNVEFVLWTGDGLAHSSHPMFESKKLDILRNITELLSRTFSSQFVFPVLGHEDGTTTNFRRMGELWRHWLPSEALHTFEKGGYYSIEQTKSRLRIIALNTNFMRHDPKYSQSHLAAVRQRQPNSGIGFGGGGVSGGGGGGGGNGNDADSLEYKNFYYHHGGVHQHHNHGDWSSGNSGYGYNNHHRMSNGNGFGPVGATLDVGGRVSALSEYENQDTEKQWLWLEDVLTKSKNNKETVYIVGHMPPGSDERYGGSQPNGHTTFTENNNMRYLELVRKYSSIIQGQFFGHLHSDSFRIIYDDKGKPVSWMMISPSVTPRKMSVGSNNPAMRLYKFDTDSGQVLDYTQYYLDLSLANTLGEPNWMPEYNLTHYYGLNDISAISLHNFVDRFTSNDGSWFAKYYRANTVRYQTDACEGVCMLSHYCAITRVDYKEFRQCLQKEQSALRSHSSVLSSCPLLILLCSTILSCSTALKVLPKLIKQMQQTLTTSLRHRYHYQNRYPFGRYSDGQCAGGSSCSSRHAATAALNHAMPMPLDCTKCHSSFLATIVHYGCVAEQADLIYAISFIIVFSFILEYPMVYDFYSKTRTRSSSRKSDNSLSSVNCNSPSFSQLHHWTNKSDESSLTCHDCHQIRQHPGEVAEFGGCSCQHRKNCQMKISNISTIPIGRYNFFIFSNFISIKNHLMKFIRINRKLLLFVIFFGFLYQSKATKFVQIILANAPK